MDYFVTHDDYKITRIGRVGHYYGTVELEMEIILPSFHNATLRPC